MALALTLMFYVSILGDSPVSPKELKVAIATLEERLTSTHTYEVSLLTQFEFVPEFVKNRQIQPMPDTAFIWVYKDGMQLLIESAPTDRNHLRSKTVYDGKTTHEWMYNLDGTVKDVFVRSGAPRRDALYKNLLPKVLGIVDLSQQQTLMTFVNDAQRDRKLNARRIGSQLELGLGTHTTNGATNDITVILDADHALQLQSWSKTSLQNERGQHYWKWIVDEFQKVRDEASGEDVWFPRRAHHETIAMIWSIEIQSVRINHAVSDTRFAHESPPEGTTLFEVPPIPGALHKKTIVGGEPARQKRRAETKRNLK